MVIPTDFSSLTKAVAVCWSSETGNAFLEILTEFGATGEALNANTDSIAATTYAMTANNVNDIDIIATFTGVAAGDRIGLQFTRKGQDAGDTITSLFLFGVLLEYS